MSQNNKKIYYQGVRKNAQALVEVAIVGTILLFCLLFLIRTGLYYNYQQNLEMSTFRDALVEAYASRFLLKGYSETTLVDKHIPDPSNPFGIGSTQPFFAGHSAAWSQDLMGSMGSNSFPRMILTINGYTIVRNDPNSIGLTMAGTRDKGAPSTIYVKVNDYPEDITDPYSDLYVKRDPTQVNTREYRKRPTGGQGDGVYWRWVMVRCKGWGVVGRGYVVPDCVNDDNDVFEGNFEPPSNTEKTVYAGSYADVDNDYKEEQLIQIWGDCYEGSGEYTCEGFRYFDFEQGEINASERDQGLQPDYTITKFTPTGDVNLLSIDDSETKREITENINTGFEVKRQVLLNNGTYMEVTGTKSIPGAGTYSVDIPFE